MLDMEPLYHAADVKGQPVSVESASNQNAPPAADQNRNGNGNLAGGQPPAAPAYGGGYGAHGAGGGYGAAAPNAGAERDGRGGVRAAIASHGRRGGARRLDARRSRRGNGGGASACPGGVACGGRRGEHRARAGDERSHRVASNDARARGRRVRTQKSDRRTRPTCQLDVAANSDAHLRLCLLYTSPSPRD